MRSTKGSRTAEEAAASRIIVRLELTPQAKAAYNNLVERTGRTQISTTAKLIEWFAAQPEGLQAAILGQYPPEIAPEIAHLLLEQTDLSRKA